MAAQASYHFASPVASVTKDTHPFTYNCSFLVPDVEHSNLVTMEGFRNLLEAHIGTLNKAKQVSYTRNAEWLNAIRDTNPNRPEGYAGNTASWKNEIGATNPATSKWVVENGKVYKKDKNAENGREQAPMTSTEGLYNTMIFVHAQHGHKGRDNFFNIVKQHSGSVKKAFCHQFVQVCCEKAESWQGGHVTYGWQAPVKRRGSGDDNDIAVINNMNAVDSINLPAHPQNKQQYDQHPDHMNLNPENFNFNEIDPELVDPDWNLGLQLTFHNSHTPPGSQGLGAEQNPYSNTSAPPTPPGSQHLVGAQYPAVNSQNLGNFHSAPVGQAPYNAQYGAANNNQYIGNLQTPPTAQSATPELVPCNVGTMNGLQNSLFYHNGHYFIGVPIQMQMQASQQMYAYGPSFAGQPALQSPYNAEVEQQNQATYDNNMGIYQHNYPIASNGFVAKNSQSMSNSNNTGTAQNNNHTIAGNGVAYNINNQFMGISDMLSHQNNYLMSINGPALNQYNQIMPQNDKFVEQNSRPMANDDPNINPNLFMYINDEIVDHPNSPVVNGMNYGAMLNKDMYDEQIDSLMADYDTSINQQNEYTANTIVAVERENSPMRNTLNILLVDDYALEQNIFTRANDEDFSNETPELLELISPDFPMGLPPHQMQPTSETEALPSYMDFNDMDNQGLFGEEEKATQEETDAPAPPHMDFIMGAQDELEQLLNDAFDQLEDMTGSQPEPEAVPSYMNFTDIDSQGLFGDDEEMMDV